MSPAGAPRHRLGALTPGRRAPVARFAGVLRVAGATSARRLGRLTATASGALGSIGRNAKVSRRSAHQASSDGRASLAVAGWRPLTRVGRPNRGGIWVLLVAAAVLAAAFGSGRGSGPDSRARATAGAPAPLAGAPATAPARALSSSWYCAGASGQGGPAPATLVVANLGRKEVGGSVSVVSTKGPARSEPISVAPRSARSVPYSQLAQGPYAAATAVLYGGDVAAWQIFSGSAGPAAAACSPVAAGQWYLASGSTAGSNQIELALYNPLASDAVADLSFATTHGVEQPGDFQGIVVPPRRLVMVDVGQHVQQQQAVATTVTARFGRLVVDQLSTSGTGQGTSAAVALGAAGQARSWYFPAGEPEGGTTSYQVLNPGSSPATVQVQMGLAKGRAAPFTMTVPAGAAASLATANQPRLPPGVAYSVRVQAGRGASVVAERTESSSSGSLASSLIGAPSAARSWVLLAAPGQAGGSRLVLQDPAQPAVAAVSTVAGGRVVPVAGLERIMLTAGRPQALPVPGGRSGVLLVRASRPVVAEWVNSVGSRGLPAMGVVGP
jgi:hypothetical protein